MTREDMVQAMRSVLHQIAPEADLEAIGPDEGFREALDLDSMDFLNFVVGIHDRTGIDIPERDYPELATFEGCLDYLLARSA